MQAAEIIIYANQGAASGLRDLAAALREGDRTQGRHCRAAGAAFMQKINTDEPGDVVAGFFPAGSRISSSAARWSKAPSSSSRAPATASP